MLPKLLSQLFSDAGVTDVHIKEGEQPWYRRNGKLELARSDKVTRQHINELLDAAASGLDAEQAIKRLDQNGDLDFALELKNLRCRANLYWTATKKLTLALRRLHTRAPAIETLGLPAGYVPLLNQSRGLILVTGATGSGKSTTLAASIEYLNSRQSAHIITLEDPIEYVIESRKCRIDQRQVGRDTKSFAAGLRSALRQDPDVLLVGELRDFETVKTALDAANTGHLVLASLHTHSAQQTVERLVSFFNDDRKGWAQSVVSQVLLGVLSQTLLPRKDGNGMLLAPELMLATPDIRACIRDGRTHQIFHQMDTGSSRGQVRLNKVLLDMVRSGHVDAKDALFATYEPESLRKSLEG